MGWLLENCCLRFPYRFLDSAFGLARNDRFGVMNDPELILSLPLTTAAAQDPCSNWVGGLASPRICVYLSDLRFLRGWAERLNV